MLGVNDGDLLGFFEVGALVDVDSKMKHNSEHMIMILIVGL